MVMSGPFILQEFYHNYYWR